MWSAELTLQRDVKAKNQFVWHIRPDKHFQILKVCVNRLLSVPLWDTFTQEAAMDV